MGDSTAFRNRLNKNIRHWGKWARRQGLECYRVYDRELPDFPLIIDRYGEHLLVQEYVTRWEPTDAEYKAWQQQVYEVLETCFDLDRRAICYQFRMRQKGILQYEKSGQQGSEFVVQENGHHFLVNLGAYLDSGLFLDHRNARQMIQQMASGKRFLNLFAYTASFSVYAAAGGASETVSVDMSNTYLDWAQRNFALNRLDESRNRLVRDDVLNYLREAKRDGELFDLIVLDPPSFSNSKKMLGTLDIQRDHGDLIHRSMALLSEDGVMFFSTNKRGFKLDPELEVDFDVEEISHKTLAEDFRRQRPHRSWLLRH